MSSGIYVAQCDVGKGVFAARPFAPGEYILRFAGPRTDSRDPIHYTPQGANLLQVGTTAYILPRPRGLYVNHSCEPNAGLRGTRTLVAVRHIAVGEEIRFDYSTTMAEDLWTMECMCHAESCRRVIRDFHLLPETQQSQYLALGIVPRFVRKEISRHGIVPAPRILPSTL